MGKFFVLISVILGLALLANSQWAYISETTGRIADEAGSSFKMAELYAREPDKQLVMPIHGVRVKQVADTWSAPRDGGQRLHQGQDIFAPRGTPIHSATEGYVIRIGENALGGHTVSVVSAGGRVYYYAHLDGYAPELATGDHVTTETVLGYVGTTGNAKGTPPHLHFGVYTSEGAINPLPLLIDAPARAAH